MIIWIIKWYFIIKLKKVKSSIGNTLRNTTGPLNCKILETNQEDSVDKVLETENEKQMGDINLNNKSDNFNDIEERDGDYLDNRFEKEEDVVLDNNENSDLNKIEKSKIESSPIKSEQNINNFEIDETHTVENKLEVENNTNQIMEINENKNNEDVGNEGDKHGIEEIEVVEEEWI